MLLLLVVLVVALLALGLPRLIGSYLLTPDFIEARIVGPLKEASGREVSLGSIELGLGGLSLAGLEVGEDPRFGPGIPFLSIDRLDIGLDWLALILRRQVSAASVAAEGLAVKLRRQPEGRLSVAALSERLSSGSSNSPDWSLAKISIRKGSLSLSDTDGRVLASFDGLDLRAQGLLGPQRRDLSVSVTTSHLSFGRLVAESASLRGRLAGKALSISEGEMRLAGGQASFEASLLSGTQQRFAGSVSVRDIDLSELAAMLLDNSELDLSGSLSGKTELRSEAGDLPRLAKGLVGQGEVTINKGRIRGSKGLRTLARAVGLEQLAVLALEDSGGEFEIADRRLSSPRLLFGGKDTRLIMKGSVGFDTSLDLEAWVGVGPGIERSWLSVGSLLPYMRDKEGWTNIAVAIVGTLKQPRVTVPTRALAERMIHLVPDAASLIIRKSGDATGTIIKEGVGLPATILKGGREGLQTIVDEIERVLEGGR